MRRGGSSPRLTRHILVIYSSFASGHEFNLVFRTEKAGRGLCLFAVLHYLCNMIELSKHIEYLLLEHNCVIVPNLGGFVTQYIPARMVAEENLYLPPCRNIGFNPRLTLNDGLLVQSYMQAYDTNYPETVRLIEEAVGQAKRELQDKGEIEFHGIGRLTLSMDGKYGFEPNEAGVLSPELYALDSFRIEALAADSTRAECEGEPAEKKPRTQKKKAYTLSINRELANYAAAAIAAIFFYFVWATPVAQDTERAGSSAAMMIPIAPVEKAAEALPSLHQKAENAAEAVAGKESGEAGKQPEEQGNVAESGYTLVLLSSVPRSNAQAYIGQLEAEGIEGATLYERGKMVRVVYGHFASENEAYVELNRLHGRKYFADAWVMELKPVRAKR